MKTSVPALDRLARTVARGQLATASDAELLRCFRADRDADAFEALVDRHGPLILGLCKRLTGDEHLAEDAFQATFLTLSRKAGAIRQPESLPAWLFGVARRAALKARADRRRAKTLPTNEMPGTACDPLDRLSAREWLEALDAEMARLPLAQRSAVLLCAVEGKSIEEAARQLGATTGSVRGWLQRGRNRLRDGLARRGLALPAGLGMIALLPRESVAQPLVEAAVRIGTSAAGVAPSIAALATTGMSLSVKLAGILVLAAGLAGLGAALMPAVALPPDAKPQAAKPVDVAPALDPKPPVVRLDRLGDPLPQEALARFGTVRFRQGNSVGAIRYSPDGKTIAIAAGGRPLGLWDLATGKELLQFDGGSCIAFSPDGKMLATGSLRGSVLVWDTRTGKLIRELKGGNSASRALEFSADGKTVVSGANDRFIRFWDVATGRETAKLGKLTGAVTALALSHDGKLLASAGQENFIRVWDVETRQLSKQLWRQHVPIRTLSLSFSPDGKQLVSAGSDEPCLIWDLAKDQPARQLDADFKPVQTAAFSPNGKWLAAGCDDGAIRLYDATTGKEVRRSETQSRSVQSLAFSTDSKTVATGSLWESGVRFWDVKTGEDISPLDAHRSSVSEVQHSPDGKSLWSLGPFERRAIRWNTATAEPVEVVPIPPESSLFQRPGALSPGGAFLAWGSTSDKTIHVMDLKTHKDACEPLKTPLKNPVETRTVRFSPDGKVLAVGCDGGLFYIWKWQTEPNPKPLKAPDGDFIWALFFTPDGKRLATTSFGGRFHLWHVWDVATGKQIASLPGNMPGDNRFDAVAVSPDGKWAASIHHETRDGMLGQIKVIDIEKGEVAREIKVDPEGGTALAFSPDGRLLACADEKRQRSDIKLIEFATGETIATFHGHHSVISTLQFSPDGRTLYSGGGDSTILKWDATARHGKGLSTPNPESAWQALAQEASKAYPARWDLADRPREAVALLRKKIPPAKKLDPKEVRRMVDGLDADEFQDRQKASALLKSLGYSVEPLLRDLVKTEMRPEVKQRVQKLIDELNGSEFLRIQRALQVLETIGNDQAKQLLRELADGSPDSMLTKEAATVLKRAAKKVPHG